MLRWRQVQVIAEKLTSRESAAVRPGDLDEPWRTLYDRVRRLDDPVLAERELWKATEGLQDRHALIQAVLDALPLPDVPAYPSLQDLAGELPPVDWLWPAWIPRGLLSLLGGAAGAGKSLVALDLARRIIHGEPFPDGAPLPCPGANVLYVDAEAVPQIQNQRAQAWGMDRSKLYLMLPSEPYDLLDLGDEAHRDRLVQMVHDLEPALVVVDSLSCISLRGENNVEDVRALLSFLSAVAREFEVALLLVHHLRKRGKGLPPVHLLTAEDLRGSSHIITMARSVLALSVVKDGPAPDGNGPRRLEVVKTNLVPYPRPLGLRFEAGEGPAPLLRYTDLPYPYGEPTQAEACADWLLEVLAEAGEPLRPQAILGAAAEAGFAQATVYRARKLLGRQIREIGHGLRDPYRRWALAEEEELYHSLTEKDLPDPAGRGNSDRVIE